MFALMAADLGVELLVHQNPDAVARAEQATSAIDDPDLRALVTRAAARSMERDKRS